MISPADNRFSRQARMVFRTFGCDAAASGAAFGNRFGEIDFPLFEEVAEKVNVARRIPEALRDGFRGQAVHNGGAQGFVAPLPVMSWMEEKG